VATRENTSASPFGAAAHTATCNLTVRGNSIPATVGADFLGGGALMGMRRLADHRH